MTSAPKGGSFFWLYYSMILSILPEKQYSRIVSLVPSQTELLYSLGLNEEVIGITKFCIHPTIWFKNKKRIGGTKNIHISEIESLQPDLVIANKEENIKEQIEDIARFCDIWITDVNTLEEALQMIIDLGRLSGKLNAAIQLKTEIEHKFGELKQAVKKRVCRSAVYLIWQNPYMVAASGTFINDLMERAGLKNVFVHKTRYPDTTIEELIKLKPQYVLLSSEPYPFEEKHKQELQKSMPDTKVVLVDGEMFSWYGSRLLKTPSYLINSFFEEL